MQVDRDNSFWPCSSSFFDRFFASLHFSRLSVAEFLIASPPLVIPGMGVDTGQRVLEYFLFHLFPSCLYSTVGDGDRG